MPEEHLRLAAALNRKYYNMRIKELAKTDLEESKKLISSRVLIKQVRRNVEKLYKFLGSHMYDSIQHARYINYEIFRRDKLSFYSQRSLDKEKAEQAKKNYWMS